MTPAQTVEVRAATLHLLEQAVTLLRGAGKWTKGANARDRFGLPVSARSEEAVTFDGLGAIDRAAHEGCYDTAAYLQARRTLNQLVQPGWFSYTQWQDANTRTREEVIELFHQAINQLREA